MSKHVTEQMIDPVIGRRIFTLCWFCAGLGTMSAAWLVQQRPWPEASERATLARGLIGITAGLCIVWVLPVWAGLIALACLIPLLALDSRLAGRSPLPAMGSVVESWVGRYWNPGSSLGSRANTLCGRACRDA